MHSIVVSIPSPFRFEKKFGALACAHSARSSRVRLAIARPRSSVRARSRTRSAQRTTIDAGSGVAGSAACERVRGNGRLLDTKVDTALRHHQVAGAASQMTTLDTQTPPTDCLARARARVRGNVVSKVSKCLLLLLEAMHQRLSSRHRARHWQSVVSSNLRAWSPPRIK
jgi:hypothetical protein